MRLPFQWLATSRTGVFSTRWTDIAEVTGTGPGTQLLGTGPPRLPGGAIVRLDADNKTGEEG
jgi:hypothetical protein